MPYKCCIADCKKHAKHVDAFDKKYCIIHRTSNMLKITRCSIDGCNKVPLYGYNKRTHCYIHKKIDMTNLDGVRCLNKSCKKRARYGNNNIVQYCFEHKTQEMNLIHSNKCYFKGCNIKAVWKSSINDNKYCATHKLEDAVCYAKCKIPSCMNRANYGEKSNFIYCYLHKLTGMVRRNSKHDGVRAGK